MDWGEYDAPDPATLKMMFMKNVIVRRNRFSNNHDNDLWFDNSNWNVDIDGNSFTGNETEISVHTEINPFGIQIRNNTGGGIRFANSEGTIVTHNILATRSHPLITYWGTEVRYDGNNRGRINQGGPGLSWNGSDRQHFSRQGNPSRRAAYPSPDCRKNGTGRRNLAVIIRQG